MEKIELHFSEICDDLLAPGNIYWRQKSGVEILISAKADVLNYEMLEKLSISGKQLVIENSIEYGLHIEFKKIFREYESEIQLKKKLKWRKDFISLLMKSYYNSEKSQFELDQLCWKLFSEIKREEGLAFLDRDRDYFKRSMNIASSYVLCAFLIGYYDAKFLKNIYNSTIKSLMNVGKDKLISTLTDSLENLRRKSHLSNEDKEFVSTIIDSENFDQRILFEKFDGSGAMTLSLHELSDLELILCSLNYYYNFQYADHKNILAEIHEGNFNIDKKIINLITRNFDLAMEELKTA